MSTPEKTHQSSDELVFSFFGGSCHEKHQHYWCVDNDNKEPICLMSIKRKTHAVSVILCEVVIKNW